MPAPYSIDLRERVITLHSKNTSTLQEIADTFMISISTVKRYREECNLDPKLSPGRTPIFSDEDIVYISGLVISKPDGTLKYFCKQFKKNWLKLSANHLWLE